MKTPMEFSEKYTEKDHAELLLRMLESENPCAIRSCPSGKGRITHRCSSEDTRPCMQFLGLPRKGNGCPCDELGREEAIKLTWLKLEEKGYLE